MSARATVALAAAAVIMLALLVKRVMEWSIPAGTVLTCILAVTIGIGIAYVLMATGKGAHVAPRGYDEADERLASTLERTIPRAITEHDPPWDPAPALEAAPVIEPAAVTHGPPQPEPEPEAYWIAAGTVTDDGRVRLDHVAVLPPPVQTELGHRTVDEALESMFTRAMALKVRALTDGTS